MITSLIGGSYGLKKIQNADYKNLQPKNNIQANLNFKGSSNKKQDISLLTSFLTYVASGFLTGLIATGNMPFINSRSEASMPECNNPHFVDPNAPQDSKYIYTSLNTPQYGTVVINTCLPSTPLPLGTVDNQTLPAVPVLVPVETSLSGQEPSQAVVENLPQIQQINWDMIDKQEVEVNMQIGELIVTQGWNSDHMGADLAYPGRRDTTGFPLHAIGQPGQDVKVLCWGEPLTGVNVSTYAEGMPFAFDYAHMDTCMGLSLEEIQQLGPQSFTIKAGEPLGTIGNTGSATTGPHLHFQQREGGNENPITGTHVPGYRGYIEMAVNGLPN